MKEEVYKKKVREEDVKWEGIMWKAAEEFQSRERTYQAQQDGGLPMQKIKEIWSSAPDIPKSDAWSNRKARSEKSGTTETAEALK